jgi:hypothetical protein
LLHFFPDQSYFPMKSLQVVEEKNFSFWWKSGWVTVSRTKQFSHSEKRDAEVWLTNVWQEFATGRTFGSWIWILRNKARIKARMYKVSFKVDSL